MAKITITGPDGRKVTLNAPDDVSPDVVDAKLAALKEQWRATEAPDVSVGESLGRGAVQGLTFGFGDEIYGAAKGGYDKLFGSGDFSGTYAKERDAVRAANDRAQEANPTAFFAGELGGGVALPLGALRTGYKAASLANKGLWELTKEGSKQGAKYGAAYGFGKGEGDAVDQAISTVGGAAGGAAGGALLPTVVQVGSAALRAPVQAARVASRPQSVAAEKFVEAMERDSGRRSLTPINAVHSASHSLNRARNAGDDAMMLADFGGENTRNLIRAANNMPNASAERFRTVLDRRQATQPRRLESSVSEKLAPGDEFYASIDDLVAKRDAMADPMFKAAFAVDTPMTKQLSSVLDRPTMKDLLEQVARRLEDEGRNPAALPKTEKLHRIKLELDEQIAMSKQAEKMGNRPTQGWDTRTLTILKNDFLNAIDNKAYKYALKKYSGSSALKNAAEDGFDEALKLAPEQLSAKLAKLSPSEAEMWRMGGARALIDKIRQGNFMRDRTKSIFDTPDMQLRLKQLFPNDKQRGEFLRTVSRERKMAITRQAAQGNSTTAKQLTQAQEAGKAARTVADVAGAATGRAGALMSLLERGYNFASGITPGVADEILKLAMLKDPGKASAQSTRAIQAAFERGQRRKRGQGLLSESLLPIPGLLSAELGTTYAKQ